MADLCLLLVHIKQQPALIIKIDFVSSLYPSLDDNKRDSRVIYLEAFHPLAGIYSIEAK